ncbi:2-C-methyl-D-erythritol 4-phosphate cytidylyltransferase [Clostridium cylindrosporum]|uniref:2-C-methyl-D-erythritol 4-phosphate cytidylyltransferase n=1 Tax=Clostridium cylindrosporum DSM 605 TaxID=1121307 RepID=A0A0J8D989_CLOCY|nr:2-C-methyl-D-erythritol 4-phosphate cytidylyltransferase [Clostridium cylindrosporum]KMT22427.1 2-C-methyl-D-erythritol 4-phosphate cytidylyltransferase IspD [Clostridium cylindrosporum DSM 605]
MVTAIIVAAGMGSRMNLGYNKQFIKLFDKEILAYTLEVFQEINEVDNIILVASQNEMDFCRNNIINKYNITKVNKIVKGGRTRQESVFNGLKSCENCDIVLIHDGARPFINPKVIVDTISLSKTKGAAAAAVKVKDTIKKGNNNRFIDTLNREELYSIQTPQTFKFDLILKAHESAVLSGFEGSDDTSLVENIGESVYVVNGDYFNIKITTKEDIYIGEAILKAIKEGI